MSSVIRTNRKGWMESGLLYTYEEEEEEKKKKEKRKTQLLLVSSRGECGIKLSLDLSMMRTSFKFAAVPNECKLSEIPT